MRRSTRRLLSRSSITRRRLYQPGHLHGGKVWCRSLIATSLLVWHASAQMRVPLVTFPNTGSRQNLYLDGVSRVGRANGRTSQPSFLNSPATSQSHSLLSVTRRLVQPFPQHEDGLAHELGGGSGPSVENTDFHDRRLQRRPARPGSHRRRSHPLGNDRHYRRHRRDGWPRVSGARASVEQMTGLARGVIVSTDRTRGLAAPPRPQATFPHSHRRDTPGLRWRRRRAT
jgi:hypothetical protein